MNGLGWKISKVEILAGPDGARAEPTEDGTGIILWIPEAIAEDRVLIGFASSRAEDMGETIGSHSNRLVAKIAGIKEAGRLGNAMREVAVIEALEEFQKAMANVCRRVGEQYGQDARLYGGSVRQDSEKAMDVAEQCAKEIESWGSE